MVSRVPFGTALCSKIVLVGTRVLTELELQQAYELRYQVIVKELGWLPDNGSGVEIDDYDSHCVHFGVIWEQGLVAYARVLHSVDPEVYMLFHTFGKILGKNKEKVCSQIDERNSCEISRLVSSPDLTKAERDMAVLLLYGRMCKWGIIERKTKWYIVVNEGLLSKFTKLGFVSEILGRGEFAEGKGVCVTACLDLLASLEGVKKNPGLYEMIFGKDQI